MISTPTQLRALAEQVDNAAAKLLIELVFLVPKGTNLWTHPIRKALTDYKAAIEASAIAAQTETLDALRKRINLEIRTTPPSLRAANLPLLEALQALLDAQRTP